MTRPLRLKKNADRRLKSGHLWLYSNEIDIAETPLKGLEVGEQVIVEAANGNAWKYHLSFKPLRWAAHSAMRLGTTLAPERMLRQFAWIHGHDVTAQA